MRTLLLAALVALQLPGTLAPSGTLRAGFLAGNPVQAQVDARTGAVNGPAADLVKELARRLDVPFEIVPLPNADAVIESVKAHRVDIGFLAYEAARARQVDFSAPYAIAQSAFLVRADSPIRSSRDVDRTGVRVAAVSGVSQQIYLSGSLKQARLRVLPVTPSPADIEAMVVNGQVDAFAANRARMEAVAARTPRLRVLPDNFLAIRQAIVVDKARAGSNAARLDLLNQFIFDVVSSGFVTAALERGNVAGASVAPPTALSPFIDVHTHIEKAVAAESVDRAIGAMRDENVAKYLFLPSPFDRATSDAFDIELLQSASRGHADQIATLGGGGTLNPMIQEAVLAGTTSPDLEKRFRDRAETIARLGAKGFGELTAEHRPSASTPAYQSAPPDHRLFLLLADLAAAHNIPITLHMEAVPETMPIPRSWPVKPLPNPPQLRANIAAFERLLAHNPRAKIVWAHAGWDNTGFRTPALLRRLLGAHPNLFMELKIDPLDPGLNSPLTGGASGTIKPDWLKLFQDFPDRFVIGSDQHYPMPAKGPQRWESVVLLFNQLPPALRRTIGVENATRIYNLR